MKKIYRIIIVMAAAFAVCGCLYDDSDLTERIDDFKNRIEALKNGISEMNASLEALGELTGGNVITSVMEDSDGNYVISYLDGSGDEKSVVIATASQMLNVPMLGVQLDPQTQIYWWTMTDTEGNTSFLTIDGKKVPVSGNAPEISVNEDGFWTVSGEVLKDSKGNPIEAKDGESCIFRSVSVNADGNLEMVLGNGKTVTLPVQNAFNLTLSAVVNNTVADASVPVVFSYDVSGSNADGAIVAIAKAEGLDASMDRENKRVTVTFPDGFASGMLIMVGYDLADHTVIRPLFFDKASSDMVEIATAEDFVRFAEGVNARNGMEMMKACLTGDIDMTSVKDWTPIGNGTYTTSNVISGASYKGEFDGRGHTVKNLKVSVPADAPAGTASGLFGILQNASVKNLKIDRSCSFSSSVVGMSAMGTVAGYACASVIEDCSCDAVLDFNGGSDNMRTSIGGVAGALCCIDGTDAKVSGCEFSGKITSVNASNTKNGGTGISIGGIIGFSDALGTPGNFCLVSGCTNNGTLDVQATRTAGIIASMNKYSKTENCVNNGAVTCTDVTASNSRVAGIVSGMGTKTSLYGCINNGDVTFAVAGDRTHGYAGGVVGQTNEAVFIDACENYGAVRSDMFYAAEPYMGIIVGNFNSKAATVSNCKLGGSIGPYSESPTSITEENFGQYLSMAASKAGKAILDNNTFAGSQEVRKGISTAAELALFRDLVNSGESYAQFQDEDGVVNLMADIDCSSLEGEWMPIGMPASVSNGNTSAGYTGASFKGRFNGNGHVISNLNLSAKVDDSSVYGFFGVLDGASVENLVLGSEGDRSVFRVSAAGAADAGVLAGTAINSLISDVVNNIPIEVLGNDVNNKRFAVGTVGFLCSVEGTSAVSGASVSSMTGVVNNAEITASAGACTASGAASVMVGGIAGFSTSASATVLSVMESCRNNGRIVSHVGRASGIVATPNRTLIRYCSNYGDHTNDFVNGRIGNIACVIGANVLLDDCFNYGSLVTSDAQTTAAGLVALLNNDSCAISAGGNYGTVICANSKYHGLLVANFSKFASVSGCMAAGACGSWSADGNHLMHELTADNFMSHIGAYAAGSLSKITDIHSPFGPGGGEQEKIELADAPLRILCIGNSFTKDAVEHLPGMMAAAGIDNVVIAHCYYGGRTIPEYTAGWSVISDYTLYYCAPGADAWTTPVGRKVSLKEVAQSGRWDVVTFQEHTGNKAAWIWDDKEKEAITALADYVRGTQSATPKFWYIMSQAYSDMAKIGSGSRPEMSWTDQKGMYEVIVAQGRRVMAETPMDGIIATGTYLQNLRTSSVNVPDGMDLTRDGYHMDYGISRYGAACVVFESLITPFSGIGLDGNTYRYNVSNTVSGSWSTPVTDKNVPYALAAARHAVAKPWEITDMSSFAPEIPGGGIGDIDYVEGGKE